MTVSPFGLRSVEECEWALLRGLQNVLRTGDLNPIRDALYEMSAQDPARTRRFLEQIQAATAAPAGAGLAELQLRR